VFRAAPGIGPLVPLNAPDHQRLAALLRAPYVDASAGKARLRELLAADPGWSLPA
jgi:hypothetical protein